jgi:hypothetical protein
MMKVMTELSTKNQESTTTSSFTTGYYILSSLPSYDGFDSNKYFVWEIGMDKNFGQCHICERRKLRNVSSVLTNNALAWWKHLYEYDELPKTWNSVKILMRKSFVDSSPTSNLNFEIHSLEEEPTIASPIVPNILQKVKIKQKKEITESFEEVVILNVPCIIQDDNDHNTHILANELNKGNEKCCYTHTRRKLFE